MIRRLRSRGATFQVRKQTVSLDKEQLRHIALLARLHVADRDVADTLDKLSRIVGFVDRLAKAPTDGVAPMAHPVNAAQGLRPDVVTEADERERIQRNAAVVRDGLYLVPRVIE